MCLANRVADNLTKKGLDASLALQVIKDILDELSDLIARDQDGALYWQTVYLILVRMLFIPKKRKKGKKELESQASFEKRCSSAVENWTRDYSNSRPAPCVAIIFLSEDFNAQEVLVLPKGHLDSQRLSNYVI
ncbi:hypothetical protein GOBAR_DD34586 [Gossypium barbadense]|nr:hypothetical protein GOBAR_DD34586 [Gossypium barbadense]